MLFPRNSVYCILFTKKNQQVIEKPIALYEIFPNLNDDSLHSRVIYCLPYTLRILVAFFYKNICLKAGFLNRAGYHVSLRQSFTIYFYEVRG